MPLVQMNEVEGRIFRAWLNYLGESTPEARTRAFFAARRGEWPPCSRNFRRRRK